jgi:hypothetical protein
MFTLKVIDTEVLVVGGGSAGIAAAVSAAQSGRKVALIERSQFLGGKATSAEVGTICGLYKFSKSPCTEYIVNGFVREFAEELRMLSQENPLSNSYGLHYLPYNIDAYKKLCAQRMHENNITVYLQSEVIKVDLAANLITGVLIKEKASQERIQINCKTIIDCSGNSCVSELANLPLIVDNQYQAAAQIFTMQGIAPTTEPSLNLVVLRELKRGVCANLLKDHFERVYLVQGSLKNDVASFKLAVPLTVTHEENNISDIRQLAVDMVHRLVEFLVEHTWLFKNASLQSIAPEVGIRVGIRPVGRYILNEDDVLKCKKFDLAIANGAWPIEEWGEGKKVKMQFFDHDDFYQIPADCLKSNTIKNLFFAGRNISATSGAIASARVMGICLQTGYAAGKLAANLLLGVPDKKTIRYIQESQVLV